MIDLFGVTWLADVLDVSASKAVELGLTPFLILLPAAHRLTRR